MNPIAAIADVGYVQENRRLLEGDAFDTGLVYVREGVECGSSCCL